MTLIPSRSTVVVGARPLMLQALPTAAAACLSVAVGVTVGRGQGVLAAAALITVAAFAAGLASWRRSVYGLLVYLPFCGLPVLILYPSTTPALLAKDVLFVLPAYLGFLAAVAARRISGRFGVLPVALLCVFALFVLGQALNPSLPNLSVGAVGAKVWLLYIPLALVGYELVATRHDLDRVLAVASIAGIPSLVVGLGESLLLASGHRQLVYSWYGPAAAAATQNFAQFDYSGGGVLYRVPGLFSFGAQYFCFTLAMVAVTYAWWRGSLANGARSIVGRLTWLLAVAASLSSGARVAFVVVPLLVVALVSLERRRLAAAALRVGPVVALLLGVAALVGAAAPELLMSTLNAARLEFGSVFISGFEHVWSNSWLGTGTGSDTGASRHVFAAPDLFSAVGGAWLESWWVKAYAELGLVGFALLVGIFAVLLRRGFRIYASLTTPQLRAVAGSVLALIGAVAFLGVKSQYVDLDPLNAYFWLFVGVLFALPRLSFSAADS